MYEFDLVVLGAGPGGYTAALRAARLGLRTAVVENREAGGTCLNRGCVPTKTLLHASEVYHGAASGGELGVCAEGLRLDMEAMFAYKRRVSQTLSDGIEGLFKSAKVTSIHGTGVITAPHHITVTADDEERQLTARYILVATGSVPARPPIPGLDLPGVLTSDELLEGADHLYESIVIIGGGVIGVELATFYAELGSRVTVVEGLDRLLPTMDRELGQNLALILKKQGVTIATGAMVEQVEQVEQSDNGLAVHYTQKGERQCACGEVVLCAIGRKPYWRHAFAPDLAPECNGPSLKVDGDYRTSIEDVYAIGDVSSAVQLAHMAAAQGTACVENLCGVKNGVDLSVVPSCIYCRPEIATVGITEAQAKEQGRSVKVGKCVMGGNARTLIAGLGRSFMKLVADSETGVLLGAQLMCANSTDMISQLAQAIAGEQTAASLLRAMRPHPTFEEALGEALEDLCAKLEK